MTDHKIRYVYVITGSGERKFWTKVGAAFVNRDNSLNVKLDALPVDGELHIREPSPREDDPSEGSGNKSRPRGTK